VFSDQKTMGETPMLQFFKGLIFKSEDAIALHIFRGHCDYLKPRGVSVMLEGLSSPTQSDAIDWLTIQATEFDADAAAAAESLLSISDMPWKPDFQWLVDSLEKRIFLWSFSISVVFIMFDLNIDPDNLADRAHPPSALRFFMLCSMAVRALKHSQKDSNVDFRGVIDGGFLHAAKAVSLIGGSQPSDGRYPSWADPRVSDHLQKVADRWKSLLSDLEPYARS
jgi:hypothetical protein